MYGNLSKTIVSVPKAFHLSAYLTNFTFPENKYKEPQIYDTFSCLKKNNSRHNRRYFRLKEHFQENAPYRFLNFNNNKRYVSPVLNINPSISLSYFLFSKDITINKKLRIKKSTSQGQLFSKTNSMNISKVINKEISKDNNNETHSSQMINIMNNSMKENITNFQQIDFIEEKNNLSKINEVLPVEENTKDININEENITKNSEEEEKQRQENYMNKLLENKPHNLEELKTYLNMKYTDETKSTNFLPKITKVHNSISQDDLFKKTMNLKLASLSMIRPKVKEGIFKRKKNMILKRDYEIIRRIYNVRKKLPLDLRNIISYEALANQ
mgnify:FL=1